MLAFGVLTICAHAQSTVARPRILGIDHVSFYTTQPDGAKGVYGGTLGLASAEPVESGGLVRYMVGRQWVGYSSAPDPKATDRMDHVAFTTNDIAPAKLADSAASRRMIHTGFLVHSRDAEDHFYRDLLGFRLYWHGGMQPGETDWVAMQVPDGTDWLEYMLNQTGNPDLRLMGVLNHISLGVVDMKKEQTILESHGWKPHDGEKAQMGKDGKWQLNVFDPDLTRIELMEFKPVERPCCNQQLFLGWSLPTLHLIEFSRHA